MSSGLDSKQIITLFSLINSMSEKDLTDTIKLLTQVLVERKEDELFEKEQGKFIDLVNEEIEEYNNRDAQKDVDKMPNPRITKKKNVKKG